MSMFAIGIVCCTTLATVFKAGIPAVLSRGVSWKAY
ncbi:hypothetical protein ALP87_200067 [Pseudomonas syringae pv. coriandricola]|nr:hypothetical protein ALP87_200067 [Pseudomonas syringae pv. coriandricola]